MTTATGTEITELGISISDLLAFEHYASTNDKNSKITRALQSLVASV